uniref:Cytochrome c oxidase subunit 2 n=1 Tax=Nomia chalybeata TaxID=2448184 RepID=A0A7L8EYC1_9HYME|nr:cytochrome c oxidase subunit II [Nomia chalybeata]QOE17501.1 cytochrome c oxidase subunit 2 [Nomia chalybeata]
MAHWNMYSFPDSNSPLMDNLIYFYNFTMIILLMITMTTIFMNYMIIYNKYINLKFIKNHNLETIWTVIPMIMLLIIAIPSLKMLYFIDELWNPTFFSIKSIGHQWYWSYEYPEFNNISIDSYMINNNSMKLDTFRLLDVDNRLIIPFNTPIRILTTSLDVIHSWTIPTLGIKMDSTPGRINQMTLISLRPGLYFGQCSEICGAYHSFMPISLESTNINNFMNWINNQ